MAFVGGRCTASELDEIQSRARSVGWTVSRYLVACALGQRLPRSPRRAHHDLILQILAITNNRSQILKALAAEDFQGLRSRVERLPLDRLVDALELQRLLPLDPADARQVQRVLDLLQRLV